MKNCQVSIGRVISSEEGTYFAIQIRNRKEKIDLEIKMNSEQFASLMVGQMITDAVLNDRLNS